MPGTISNISPLLYLYRIGVLAWLPQLFADVWVPQVVVLELEEGQWNRLIVWLGRAYGFRMRFFYRTK